MSADANPERENMRRPLWLAGLVGTAIPYLLGSIAMAGWAARLDPGGTSVTGSIDQLEMALTFGAWLALPSALAMLLLMLVIGEPRKPSPLRTWLLSGVAAAMPVAVAVWLVSHLGDCFDKCPAESSYLVPPVIIEGLALLGAAIGWRVRYGRRRA